MQKHTRVEISEADWKLWRDLSKEVLERYCQKILTEAATYETGRDSAHERYLKLYRLVQRRDREIADVFNNPRRSSAYQQIALALRNKIITRAELRKFSEATQEIVDLLAS